MKILQTATDKDENSKGQTCWPGYRRHPTIKEGPGSCIKADTDRDASEVMYGIVLEDPSGEELLIGKGCVRLTKRFARYGVSAHVLPGNISDGGKQLVMIVGRSKTGVAAAVKKFDPSKADTAKHIMKLPV